MKSEFGMAAGGLDVHGEKSGAYFPHGIWPIAHRGVTLYLMMAEDSGVAL